MDDIELIDHEDLWYNDPYPENPTLVQNVDENDLEFLEMMNDESSATNSQLMHTMDLDLPIDIWVLIDENDHVRVASTHYCECEEAKATVHVIVDDWETYDQLMTNCGYYKIVDEQLIYDPILHLESDRAQSKTNFNLLVNNLEECKTFIWIIEDEEHEVVWDTNIISEISSSESLLNEELIVNTSIQLNENDIVDLNKEELRDLKLAGMLFTNSMTNMYKEWLIKIDSIDTLEELSLINEKQIVLNDIKTINRISVKQRKMSLQ